MPFHGMICDSSLLGLLRQPSNFIEFTTAVRVVHAMSFNAGHDELIATMKIGFDRVCAMDISKRDKGVVTALVESAEMHLKMNQQFIRETDADDPTSAWFEAQRQTT